MVLYKMGSKGTVVRQIQVALNQYPDGIFGPKTKRAVEEFQAQNNLKVDGIVGPATMALLFPEDNKFVLTQQEKQKSRTITHIFVHCTATELTTTPQQLLDYFYKIKKWSRPGYHYVVDSNGKVTQLWTESKYSNGIKNMNSHSINIAWIGGIDEQHPNGIDNRTNAQKNTLLAVLKELRRKYPKAVIMGHRDTSPDLNHNGIVDPWERIKACPCFNAMEEYKSL